MGVPKFFRWMSERYPAISQLIAENRIPEFDNLYLDMNGIIHNCTHNDSDSVTHRMSEDQMFIAIFNYIEHLFGKIKPQKLFFMAIDGVAPRAKMNQQRARRFRTALDVEKAREKAIKEGVEMPKEDAFDSNCITPGTQFMARLTKHLKYFVNKKVSEDADWQGVEIVLSGHEVPGEGEHKIMEYIRQAKAQPDYDPNRRHCLYGLDADLIMLGLLSHDPHFCLLREEVTFGRASKGKSKELEHQNFYLMHLCIVREYLELEFQELKEPGTLDFPFDMERVIDDFILMAFFVGNDFLPNLPHLHINEGALALMFAVYKSTLPKAKGYINEGGVINMDRLALLLEELSHVEYRFFESENADAAWFKGKRLEREDVMEKTKRKGQLVITTDQSNIFRGVEKWVTNKPKSGGATPYDLPVTLPARDRKFVEELAESLNVQWKSVQDDEGNRHMQLSFPAAPGAFTGAEDSDDEDEEEDPEAQQALARVIKRYHTAKIVDMNADEAQAAMDKKYEEKFQSWKSKHYEEKFGWGLENEAELTKLAENYVQGLQWVLYYYYQGVASWPWYYQYHYSPFISDVKKGLKADINFKLGQPFRPFQQLMGVLPDRSKSIVPTAYWPLMTDPNSPIIDFYPRDFELDMNGKKQEWEAVVKIPFIQEDRLLSAMATKDNQLSEDEVHRNSFGASLKFTYQQNVDFIYPSSLPGFFPDLEHCHCVENIYELPVMDGLEYFIGLMPGAQLGTEALAGFPSLKTLPFTGQLDFHGVNVFQSDSRNESMVVTLTDSEIRSTPQVAKSKLGKAVYVGYPFLQEAKIVRVSDELFAYCLAQDGSGRIDQFPHDPRGIENFRRKADKIESMYSKKLGMVIGSVEALVHVDMLKGLKKTDDGATIKEYGEIPGTETDYAPQIIVDEAYSQDQRFIEKAAVPVEEEFSIGSKAFFLGDYAYGRPCEVIGHENGKLNLWVSVLSKKEPDFGLLAVRNADQAMKWTPSYAVARQLQMNPLALSKITSSLTVESSGLKLNLGLNLKFEAKGLKVLGYSRKGQTGWEYSPKAIDLIIQYMTKFPEFIAGIGMNPKGNIYTDTMFYDEKIAKTKVKEIGAWLKSIESKGFEKVPLDAEQLDSDAVGAIQHLAEQNIAISQSLPKPVNGVPRNALLNPLDAETRISGQRFSLGDRVVYVLSSGRVPIAQRGTVVGLTRTSRQTLLDIVFDASFMSGTSLGERCKPFFGSTVPSDSVLNITNKQFVALSQASKAKAPVQHSQPLGTRGYGAPNGQSQLRPAAAPQQSAWTPREHAGGYQDNQGSFGQQQLPFHNGPPSGRGRAGYANVNSSNGGPQLPRGGRGGAPPAFRGRGRGGFQQGGQPGAQNGTPPVQQTYNAVPPPSNLNVPRGGRGGRGRGTDAGRGGPRGRGRGRGGVGKGGEQVHAASPAPIPQ